MQNAKNKVLLNYKTVVPYDKNQRAIEKVEELIVAEKNLYDRIYFQEKNEIELKGDVVVETASQMDKLIRKALRKHERAKGDGNSPSARARVTKRSTKYLKSSRNIAGYNVSDTDSNNSGSPVRKLLSPRRNFSKLSISP